MRTALALANRLCPREAPWRFKVVNRSNLSKTQTIDQNSLLETNVGGGMNGKMERRKK
jgi:hypothetical protein